MNGTEHTQHFTEKGGMRDSATVAFSMLHGILSSSFPPFPQTSSIKPNAAYSEKKKMRIRKGTAFEKNIY